MQSVLQTLLEHGVVEIDDDEVMEKLLATAESLEKQLTAGRLSVAAATLVAMDPEISPGEPLLESTYQSLAESWKTVKTRHPDKPLALLRGVLTQALVTAGRADPIAAVIWLTANSYRPYAPLAREEDVWRAILLEMRERAERAAEAIWNGQREGSRVDVLALEVPSLEIAPQRLNSEWLAPHLAVAAGRVTNPPQDATPNSHPITGPPYQAQRVNPDWANSFGTSAAKAIADGVNSCLRNLAESIDLAPLSGALKEHAQRIGSAVNDALAPLHAVELRTRVLYWRESLFSRSQRQPYRKLSAPVVALTMAADLSREMPAMSPASVDNILWEAAHVVLGSHAMTIGDFAGALAAAQDVSLTELLGDSHLGSGRKTLLAFIRQAVTAVPGERDVRAEVGVRETETIRFSDLACWLFRDLQAEKIAANIAPRVPRKRK